MQTRASGERGCPPSRKSICDLESVVTFQTRFGTFRTRPGTFRTRLMGNLHSPGLKDTPLSLSYGDTLQARVGVGVTPLPTNFICALVSVVSFQTRLCTFQTRPGTFQPRLARSSTGWGQQKRFPPFLTEAQCRRVPVGGPPPSPPPKIPVAPWFS